MIDTNTYFYKKEIEILIDCWTIFLKKIKALYYLSLDIFILFVFLCYSISYDNYHEPCLITFSHEHSPSQQNL